MNKKPSVQEHANASIDFYFDFSSPYGFIAAMGIDALASQTGRTVRWQPFLLGSVFKKYGQSPLEHSAKRSYVNDLDAPRTARLLGLNLKRPEGWPQHSLPPSRIFYWLNGFDPERAADFARAAYRAYWLEGHSTADNDTAIAVATSLGFKQQDVTAGMHDPLTKARLVRASDDAIDRGVFGSPFFVVDGELFWGSDRMEQVRIWIERGSF